MNHNQAPFTDLQQPAAANLQADQEYQLPTTGAELVAQFEGRMSEAELTALRAVGERYDQTMQELAAPSSQNTEKLQGRYTSNVEKGFDRVSRSSVFSPSGIDSYSSFSRFDTSDNRIIGPVAASLTSKLEIGRKEGVMGAISALTSPDVISKAATVKVASDFREKHVAEAQTVPEKVITKEKKSIPRDAVEIAEKGLRVGGDLVKPDLEMALQHAATELESNYAAKPREAKLGRFLLRRSGAEAGEGSSDGRAQVLVQKLDSAITWALIVRMSKAEGLSDHLSNLTVDLIKDKIGLALKKAASDYKNDVMSLADNEGMLSYISDALNRQGFTVQKQGTQKPYEQQESDTPKDNEEHVDRTVYDHGAVAAVDAAISTLRQSGMSNRDIRRKLMSDYHPDQVGDSLKLAEQFRYLNSLRLGKAKFKKPPS